VELGLIHLPYLRGIIAAALEEDVGSGDVTSEGIFTGKETGKAVATAKAELVCAGLEVFRETFRALDDGIAITTLVGDGQEVGRGNVLAEVEGRILSILAAERTALNFLQRLCGIATLTRRYVKAVEGTGARIIDTRKTVPGLRLLDKYAVRCGGGYNHRFALYDGVLIKDNHIAAAGGIAAAVALLKGRVPHTLKIEVEVGDLGGLEEAIRAGADVVMLDNMEIEAMAEAVRMAKGRVLLEASGNMTLERVRAVAETGVDFISVGALTHSAAAADISLTIVP